MKNSFVEVTPKSSSDSGHLSEIFIGPPLEVTSKRCSSSDDNIFDNQDWKHTNHHLNNQSYDEVKYFVYKWIKIKCFGCC